MAINRDFRDLFSALNASDVRFLVVGGYAVAFHGRPRFTKDLDVWIEPVTENAGRAWRALAGFGAPMDLITPEDLCRPGMVFQLGVPPNRIDILTEIAGVTFSEAWQRRVDGKYGDADIHVISRLDLIANKRAVGRPEDLLDLRALDDDGSSLAP